MKKNLMTVLIMALVVVNVALSAIIMITIIPATKQSNELITKVCTAIDLELESGKVFNPNTIPVEQTEVRSLTNGEAMTFNLMDDAQGKSHYVVAKVSITLNKEDSDYEEKSLLIEGREELLQEIVTNTFLKYSYNEVRTSDGQDKVRNEMLEQIQELFDSDFIIAVNISNANYQ